MIYVFNFSLKNCQKETPQSRVTSTSFASKFHKLYSMKTFFPRFVRMCLCSFASTANSIHQFLMALGMSFMKITNTIGLNIEPVSHSLCKPKLTVHHQHKLCAFVLLRTTSSISRILLSEDADVVMNQTPLQSLYRLHLYCNLILSPPLPYNPC